VLWAGRNKQERRGRRRRKPGKASNVDGVTMG